MDYQGQFYSYPLGLEMALLMNEKAKTGFDGLSETEKEHIIMKCRDAKTKEEMDRIVDSISPTESVDGLLWDPEN